MVSRRTGDEPQKIEGQGGTHDAREALAEIAKQRPDLILMDIQLPIMDGYTATRRIKADPAALRSIPIIAVTSYALSGEDKKAREAGCDDYIPKPYSPRELLAKVREYLFGLTVFRCSAVRLLLAHSGHGKTSALCRISGAKRFLGEIKSVDDGADRIIGFDLITFSQHAFSTCRNFCRTAVVLSFGPSAVDASSMAAARRFSI